MSTLETALTFETVEDLVKHLGDIPLARIRMQPSPGTATEEDVIPTRYCELIDGILVEKAMGFYESSLASVLIMHLNNFVMPRNLGIVLGEGGMMRVEPSQVRIPDVAYYSWEQFPSRRLPQGSILDRIPDLAVEVLSPSNTEKEMSRKRQENFRGGCQLIWEVDPVKKQVYVYTAPDDPSVVDAEGTLDGGEVLPGFTLKVADWFQQAGEREDA